MAYVSKEFKAERAPLIRALLKEYGLKGSVSVRNHSQLVTKIRSGAIDFFEGCNKDLGYKTVNHYYVNDAYSGVAQEFLSKLVNIMFGPDYYDNSDLMSDYFNCSHYISIEIGSWDKPYVYAGLEKALA